MDVYYNIIPRYFKATIKVDDISAEARLAHRFDQPILAKRFRDLQN